MLTLETDDRNCSRCGNDCTSTGEVCCAGKCTNTLTDRNNCLFCGNRCREDEICGIAGCACPPGQTSCGPLTLERCTDLLTDPKNCGGCGITCRADEICIAGTCGCPLGTVSCNGICGLSCGGRCFDPKSDQGNCGSCGNACDNDLRGRPWCCGGNCSEDALTQFQGNCSNEITACHNTCLAFPTPSERLACYYSTCVPLQDDCRKKAVRWPRAL